MDYDSAALERVAQRFRYEMWKSAVPDAVVDLGIDVQRFGPIQATAFTDEPEVPRLNQIQGAAEPGAIDDAEHLAAAAHNLRAAGFLEAYRSHNWQRPSLSPAATG